MGSAWGESWGVSWGDSWGAIDAEKPGGAGVGDDDEDRRISNIRRNNQVAIAFLLTLASSGALK